MSLSDIIVGYNKNDFFYVNAENNGDMPSASICKDLDTHNIKWDSKCNDDHFLDNSGNCIEKELCINKEYVGTIKKLQEKHSGASEQYNNAKDVYDQTFAHTVNLGAGILLMSYLIYKVSTRP